MSRESEVIQNFYRSFQQKDWAAMQKCYHEDIEFNDPVFPMLKGKRAKAMWHMLVAASTDLEINVSQIKTSGQQGSCHWEATYSFSKTGRKVYNKIDAEFEFKGGLIIHHHDHFNLWKWSKMALGLPGVMLGWTPFLKQKIRGMAEKNLQAFIDKNPSYQ